MVSLKHVMQIGSGTYHTLKVTVKCLHHIVNKLQYTQLILVEAKIQLID